MRMNQKFNSQTFCSSLESLIDDFVRKKPEVLSRITPRSWENFENSYTVSDKSKDNLVRLAVLSWYIPEEFGILLRFTLKEIIIHTQNDFLELLLESKASMKIFLLETNLWSTRDFFGNILNKELLNRTMTTLHCKYNNVRKPKQTQRIRGYRDKGTLVLPHEIHDYVTRSKELKEYEAEMDALQDSLLFIQGFLGSQERVGSPRQTI